LTFKTYDELKDNVCLYSDYCNKWSLESLLEVYLNGDMEYEDKIFLTVTYAVKMFGPENVMNNFIRGYARRRGKRISLTKAILRNVEGICLPGYMIQIISNSSAPNFIQKHNVKESERKMYEVTTNPPKQTKRSVNGNILLIQARALEVGSALFIPESDELAKRGNSAATAPKLRSRASYLKKSEGLKFSVYAGAMNGINGFFFKRESN